MYDLNPGSHSWDLGHTESLDCPGDVAAVIQAPQFQQQISTSGRGKSSVKVQRVNSFGFAGHMISVATIYSALPCMYGETAQQAQYSIAILSTKGHVVFQ